MLNLTRRQFVTTTAAATSLGTLSLASPTLFAAAKEPAPLKILFFGGDMRQVRADLEAKYLLDARKGGQVPNKQQDNVQGLEHLKEADLWVGSSNKRTFPSDEQLGYFKDYLAAGKPFVGYRAASHVFQNWLEADKAVFGAKYGSHHLMHKDPELVVEPAEGALEHPVFKGLKPPRPASGSYKYTEVEPDVTVLLFSGLKGDMMPHTWVREIKATGNRVFYTRYDAKQIEREADVREIFIRGIVWALNRDMSVHAKASQG
jgi:type 1 glutamine amidotransferase